MGRYFKFRYFEILMLITFGKQYKILVVRKSVSSVGEPNKVLRKRCSRDSISASKWHYNNEPKNSLKACIESEAIWILSQTWNFTIFKTTSVDQRKIKHLKKKNHPSKYNKKFNLQNTVTGLQSKVKGFLIFFHNHKM